MGTTKFIFHAVGIKCSILNQNSSLRYSKFYSVYQSINLSIIHHLSIISLCNLHILCEIEIFFPFNWRINKITKPTSEIVQDRVLRLVSPQAIRLKSREGLSGSGQ